MKTKRTRILLVSVGALLLFMGVYGADVSVLVGVVAVGLGGCCALCSEWAYRSYVRRNQLEGRLDRVRGGVGLLVYLPFGVALAILGTKAGGTATVLVLGTAGLLIVDACIPEWPRPRPSLPP